MMASRSSRILCLLSLIGISAARKVATFPELYTFGDSLTDTGNTFKLTKGVFPDAKAYWQGRFTNSPGTWADQIKAKNLSPSFDFAYGGATACFYPNITGRQALIPNMIQEVDKWLADPKRSKAKKVVVLFGGHNDLLSVAQLPWSQAAGVPKDVLACLVGMANKILKADKQATVLLASLAPINLTPLFSKLPNTIVQKLVNLMNDIIKISVTPLKFKYGNRVAFWDINSLVSSAVANPTSFGFEFASSAPCLPYKGSFQNVLYNFTLVPGIPCTNPSNYLFYDPIHPSSHGHSFVAKSYFEQLLKLKLISALPK